MSQPPIISGSVPPVIGPPGSPKSLPRLTQAKDHLRKALIAGLITLIPLFITIFVFSFILNFLTGPTKPLASLIIVPLAKLIWTEPPAALVTAGQWVLALIITLGAVYVLGVLSIFTVGRGILAAADNFIENLPLIKGIYGTTKQVISVFRRGGGGQGFQRVVLVEFPRRGTWTIGFVTNTVTDGAAGTRLVCTFIPMTPNPTSGFFQMFPEEDVRSTDLTVDQGIKIVLSGGLLAPPSLNLGQTAAGPEV